jgi:hypothetical protein
MSHYNTHNLNPATFLSLPKEKFEESFNELSVLDQIEVCLLCPWEKRLEFFLTSYNTPLIIENFPHEELFWTIKSMSPDDALLILPYVSSEQLQFFFDLEWWHKQDLRPDAIASWLFLLLESDEKIVTSWLNWISKEDNAMLPLIIRQFIKIQKKPDDMDIMEAKDVLYGYTLDNIFFIDFRAEKLAPLLDRFLRTVFDFSTEYYFGVMDIILLETNMENLEMAFQNKNRRLSYFGIPNYYEAIEILTPPPFGKARKIDPLFLSKPDFYEDYFPPFIPTLYKGDFPLLNQALMPIYGKNSMERIINEWVGVANKLMIALLNDFNDPSNMQKTLLGVGSLLNLGLSIQSNIDKTKSVSEILEVSVLEDLVRIAVMKLSEIRKKFRHLTRAGLLPVQMHYFPDNWQNIINSLDRPLPMFFDGDKEIFFSNENQINEYEDFVHDLYVWGIIMSEARPAWPDWNSEINFRNTNFPNPYEFLWHKALSTAFANVSLYGVFKIMPVPEFELVHLKEIWFPETSSIPENTLNLCFDILDFIIKKHNLPEDRIKRIIRDCLEEIRLDWENISDVAMKIDGRFTSALLVSLSKNKRPD